MSLNKRYSYVWHTGETATPFTITMRDSEGTAREDIDSATFTMVNRDTGDTLINGEDCQSVDGGVLTYRPSSEQMQTPCNFVVQFTATLTPSGLIEPSPFIEGEIVESL